MKPRSELQKELFSKHSEFITDKERDYLLNFQVRSIDVYGLSKILKSGEMQEAIRIQNAKYVKVLCPKDLKLWLIVAYPACPTDRHSNMLNIPLKPALKHIPSFLRDNMNFSQKLTQLLDPETVIKSFGVVSFYTNISYDLESYMFLVRQK